MKKILRYIFILIFLFLLWSFFLYKKYGKKDVKFNNNSIIIANHYSDFDPFFIYLISNKKDRLFFVTNSAVKNNFITRIFCWLFDCVYVTQDEPFKNIKPIMEIIKKLKQGKVMVIFPEGVIRPSREGFFEFNEGFVTIARKTNSTIYPLYIYPELRLYKKTKIYINEPVPFNKIRNKDDLSAAIHLQSIIMDSAFKINK